MPLDVSRVRLVIVTGHPSAGKSTIAQALVNALGDGWRLLCLDDWIQDRSDGRHWARRRSSYLPRIGRRIHRYLYDHEGAVFDGVLCGEGELELLVRRSGLKVPSPSVYTIILTASLEVAYMRKGALERSKDQSWFDREGVHSATDFQHRFYDPYSPQGVLADLSIDADSLTPRDIVAEILQAIRKRPSRSRRDNRHRA